MVTIAASRAWALSTLRWRSWMSHLLTVDAHLGVAARLRYLDKEVEMLPPSRSSSRPGCRQARSTSGGSTAGLRITVVANPQGTITPLALRNQLSCQWNVLGPLKEHTSSILGTPPDDQMSITASEGEPELLERKIRLRCCSGGSNAWVGSGSDGYAFPGCRKCRARVEEATVSQTLEVGQLVACAGYQRPAPSASLPDVHEELTGRGRHLLLPETDLLTPPPSPPLVVQLGVTGVPPVERSVAMQVCPYTVSTRQGKPCLLFWACRYSSGLIQRGLCGLWRCCLHLTLRRYCMFFRLKALRDMHGGGHDPEVLKELRTAPDLAPRAIKVMARSLGRAMST